MGAVKGRVFRTAPRAMADLKEKVAEAFNEIETYTLRQPGISENHPVKLLHLLFLYNRENCLQAVHLHSLANILTFSSQSKVANMI